MHSKKTLKSAWKPSHWLGLILLTLGVILLGYFWYQKPYSEQKAQRHQLRAAPHFDLSDFKGKQHTLEELNGRVVLLHFWASWCGPCLEEVPQWVELGNHFRDHPVTLVAISLDQNWADAQKILPSEKLGRNILSLLDTSGKVPEAYGSFQYPETYLLTPDLKIVIKWVGPQDWGSAQIRKLIEAVIMGSSNHPAKHGSS